ncbi:HpcH/HpaI aldolase/citrate lyase family protein [Halobacteriales archaeon Cl-PHB]
MARRSLLFAPGDRPELMRNAADSGADVVVFDLEDAVAPARREEARQSVADVLQMVDPDCEVTVRVNAAGIAADDDLAAVAAGDPRLDAVVLPKVEAAADVETLDRLLTEHGLDVPVLALVETAAGVLAAPEIAAAEPTDALVFGAEDLAADLGATRTDEGTEVLYARERTVTAATAAGVDAIDTLHTDYEDDEGLREDAAFSVQLGYDGKIAIHPRQVPIVNDAFTPDPETVEWAEAVLRARDEAAADDRAVFEVDGEMIDAPLIAQAERILERVGAADTDQT